MQALRLVLATTLAFAAASAQPAVLGAGYAPPFLIKVAPGQLMTIFAAGVGAAVSSRVAATSLPLPYSLAGISVTIDELSNPPLLKERVPILAVGKIAGATARLYRLIDRWIPVACVLHPYPMQRFDASHPRREPYA